MKRFTGTANDRTFKAGTQSYASCAARPFSAYAKRLLTDAVMASVLLSVLLVAVVLVPQAVRIVPVLLILVVLAIRSLKPNIVNTAF